MENYVIDANFFINLKNMHDFSLHLSKFGDLSQRAEMQMYISGQVFNELKFLRGTSAAKFKQWVTVSPVSDEEIAGIKADLAKRGIKTPAQDPDLSLVALAHRLNAVGNKTYLVSDDFKLAENVQAIKSPVEFLALSAFVVKCQNATQDAQERRYFKNVRKEILNYTISYALQRSDIYPVQKKIMWMLERSISAMESGVQGFDAKSCELDDECAAQQYEVCKKYLTNRKLSQEEVGQIQDFIPFLDEVKLARQEIELAKTELSKDKHNNAIKALRRATDHLFSNLQLSIATLDPDKSKFFSLIACAELARSEFLSSFLLINLSKLNLALKRLDQAALYSALAGNPDSTQTLNYLKAMILVFSNKYQEAVNQYGFTADLAQRYNNHALELKCMVGQAIALFFTDQEDAAMAVMSLITSQIQADDANLEEAQLMLSELGDYFHALGRPDIASNLYGQSLECATDAGLDHRIQALIQKIKRSSLTAGLQNFASTNFAAFIDKIYEVKDQDKYNEIIGQLAALNAQFYQDFPYFTPKNKWVSYFDLPEELRVNFEVIDIRRLAGKKTLLIGYNDSLGLLGFHVPEKLEVAGVPENYTIELTRKARVKVGKPPENIRANYLVRAIVMTDSPEAINFSRVVPRFFQEVQV